MMKWRFLPVMTVMVCVIFALKANVFATGVEQALANVQSPDPASAYEKISPTSGAQKDGADEKSPDAQPLSCEYNGTETRILEKLSMRRVALVERSGDLDMREKLLRATESRIEGQISSLKKIEAQIQALLEAHSDVEQAQLDSLVKTYSAMKAKEAARIFNGLEMPVLISIIEKMKPKVMAKVLAKMSPTMAKELTMELATHKKLPKIEG